jgi:TRAP transporter 4TM/12TM fusion protein
VADATPEENGGAGLSRRVWYPIACALAAALTVGAAAWSLGLPRTFSWGLYPQQFYAAAVALAMAIAFLKLPARRGAERGFVPWYDVVFALAGFLAAAYVAVQYPAVVNEIFFRPPEAYVPGVILTVLGLEALRRATGWALPIIVVCFILYAMFGDVFPGRLSGKAQDWQKLAGYFAYDINAILGVPISVAATIVIAFIFFGNLLGATGGSGFFTDAALVTMGGFRGGSMKIAVVASGLFGSISGSAVANVVATGVITIPMIKRGGIPAHKAAAIEAVASTGGQLMPPVMGAAAFLMAEFLQVPYSEVVVAALVPGTLYYIALFIQADLEAARLGLSRVAPADIPPARQVIGGLHYILSFALLIYALFTLHWQPERAALGAAAVVIATAFVFGYRGVRPQVWHVVQALWRTGFAVIDIILISVGAGMVIAVLNISGLSFNLTYTLVQVGSGSAFILLALSALVCIVLGMGLPTLGVYVILAALVAPALVEVGIAPMGAHLYVLYFGMMSMITPPVAIAAFAAAGIAGSDPMRTGWEAMRFGWIAYVIPVLFVLSPSLLMVGPAVEIATAIVTAIIGIWLVASAIAGHLFRKIAPPMRAAMAVAGLLALVPGGAFAGAPYTDLVGVALGAALIVWEYRSTRAVKRLSHA